MKEWLIRKLGGVPSKELETAVKWAEDEARSGRQTLESLIECDARKKDAETALETLIDKIKFYPDGYCKMDPMDLPMPEIDLLTRPDATTAVISFRVRPQPISYNVIEEFREPEARLLARVAQAAERLGRATAKAIKVEFAVEAARRKG